MIFQLHRFLSIYCLYSESKNFPFSLIYSLLICLSVIGMDSCCFQWLIIHYWPWLLWCSNGPSCDCELFKLTPVCAFLTCCLNFVEHFLYSLTKQDVSGWSYNSPALESAIFVRSFGIRNQNLSATCAHCFWSIFAFQLLQLSKLGKKYTRHTHGHIRSRTYVHTYVHTIYS